MTNETKKLADKSSAWSVVFAVNLSDAIKAYQCCEKLNVRPRFYGPYNAAGMVIQATVFRSVCEVPSSGFVLKYMSDFGGLFLSASEMEMLCPPAPELAGECRHCGKIFRVEISPFHHAYQPAFVVSEHKFPDSNERCLGSGKEPSSKIGIKRLG